jgi:DNA-binding NtrC family response regulator
MLDILVVDDDAIVRMAIVDALTSAGHKVMEAADGEQAVSLATEKEFDVAVCDVHLPKMDGLTVLRRLRRDSPGTSIVLMTAFGRIADVIGSIRSGAVDYVTKPFDPDEFTTKVIGSIAERKGIRKEFERAKRELAGSRVGVSLVAESPEMRRIAEHIEVIAKGDLPVLVSGERGTGKELIARTIHAKGPRANGPFIVVSCAALADVMMETELRELGELRPGGQRDAWFRAADGGTLVLDDVGILHEAAQASLLRVLREPRGRAGRGSGWQPLGVRVIATTRDDLSARIVAGTFLESLYYEIRGVGIHVPPLRERRSELLLLATQILARLSGAAVASPGISPRAWQALKQRAFRGNVRELEWTLRHAMTFAAGGEIDTSHLPEEWPLHWWAQE